MKKLSLLLLLWANPLSADVGWEASQWKYNGRSFQTSQVSVSTIAANSATTVISAVTTRPCVHIQNLSNAYRIAVGSHTGVNISNGFILSVSTHAATARLSLSSFFGNLYAKAEGDDTVAQPKLAIGDCSSTP